MKKRIIIRFKRKTIDKPIVYRLARDYDLIFNILRANVFPRADSMMVLEIEGETENFNKGIDYLKGLNLDIEPIAGYKQGRIKMCALRCMYECVCSRSNLYKQGKHEG
ncbi:MAG TPA: NIL domain-containing protein [Syntrophorhabdaceae bacterium]|nr:NIL domain-containing protein [Syntrophorhabdaceae bacterium]